MATEESLQKPCRRCKEQEATLQIRNDPVCRDCYRRYVATKTVKRLETVSKACNARTRTSGRPSRRKFVAGLSLGPSSAALIHVADQSIATQLSRRREPPFDLHVVHVDTAGFEGNDGKTSGDPSSEVLLERWRTRFPRFSFESVPLSDALRLDTVDWSALPLPSPPSVDLKDDGDPRERLRALLDSLPSPTARADVVRLLVRHVLMSSAARASADALLLGSGTTALAELALAETAKGRGFALPWLVNDGLTPVVRFPSTGQDQNHVYESTAGAPVEEDKPAETTEEQEVERAEDPRTTEVYVSHTPRDLLRAELVTYGTLTEPPLTDLISTGGNGGASAIVSHRDISIEEVMSRYFAGVEITYPSVVANVVRTTAKLQRLGEEEDAGAPNNGTTRAERCGVCAMPLDEQGDDRWRGELGELGTREAGETEENGRVSRICYGCSRSVHG